MQDQRCITCHAAGNDSKNVDTPWNFPNPVYQDDKKRASNWITVGASGDLSIDQVSPEGVKYNSLTARFSNYGKNEVDVFAPGMKIYSTFLVEIRMEMHKGQVWLLRLWLVLPH